MDFKKAHEILAKNLELFDRSLNETEIHQILNTLESSSYETSQHYLDLQKTRSFSKQGQNEKLSKIELEIRKSLDAEFQNRVFEECVFFLKNYETPQLLINFLVQKGLLEEACKYIFLENLPTSVFVNEILETCILKNQVFSKLQEVIQKLDNTSMRRNYANVIFLMKDYNKSAVFP